MATNSLAKRLTDGDQLALAKVITLIENENPKGIEILNSIYKHTGNAYRIGITGTPGAGKSTFANHLITRFRKLDERVGVIAVDPTSPFSGGALLGDRIRMVSHTQDEGVFIRSMATRGSLGGLAKTTFDVCDLIDCSKRGIIIIETVGVGQIEIDITKTSHTTIVIISPESGDAIQMMKAGLLEIADMVVINKSDRDGAEGLRIEIESIFDMRAGKGDWKVPIIKTQSVSGEGLDDVFEQIKNHRKLKINKSRTEYLQMRIKELVEEKIRSNILDKIELNKLTEKIIKGKETPYTVAEKLLKSIRNIK